MSAPDALWRAGGLMFSRMFEDWSIETRLFPPGGRVFSIASAGCTSLALAARGHDVTAVDVNPAQVAFVRARMQGSAAHERLRPEAGSVDRLLSRVRRAGALVGWTKTRVDEFLSLDDLEEQRRYWSTHLDTRRLSAALAGMLSPLTLRLFYPAPLARAVPPRYARILRHRFARGFSTHANRTNPYVRLLFLGESPQPPEPVSAGTLSVVEADAAGYLEACPARSFDAFTLSNILDAADANYARRIATAVERAARPGAVVVIRSFAEPETSDEDSRARSDRALLWGRIKVTTT